MWVTRKEIVVQRDGENIRLPIGEPVPEADFWEVDIVDRLERTGFIRLMPNNFAHKVESKPEAKEEVRQPEKRKKRRRGRPRKNKEE